MNKMKTLTVNGKTYEICDPSAPRIDNETVGDALWSSKHTVDRLCPAFNEQGAVVACRPVEGYPLETVTQITPAQSGTGDPSPENIRPITGRTNCTLYRGGKNLFNINACEGKPIVNGTFISWLKNGVVLQGNVSASPGNSSYANGWARFREKGWLIYLKAGSKLRVSVDYTILENTSGGTLGPMMVLLYNHDGSNDALVYSQSTQYPAVGTKTRISVGATIVADGWYYPVISLNSCKVQIENIQAEFGEEATVYEPYRGEEFTAQLGQTVYGGSYDWARGVLTLDRKTKTFDGTETIDLYGSASNNYFNYRFRYEDPSLGALPYTTESLCSHFPHNIDVFADTKDGIGHLVNNHIIYIRLDPASTVTTVDAFKAFLAEQYGAGTPVQVCYKLATPVTVRLTPRQVLALSGENVLYSDTGDTAVTGRAEPAAVMEKLINAIISLGGNV